MNQQEHEQQLQRIEMILNRLHREEISIRQATDLLLQLRQSNITEVEVENLAPDVIIL